MINHCRTVARRCLTILVGTKATRYAHGLYHALLRQTGRFGLNEPAATQELLAALAGRAGTLLDAGVNVGRYSWFMARHRRAGVPLYGFDPNADASALARRNLAGLPDVTLLPIGLAAQDQEATLAVPQDATGNPISGLGFILGGTPPPTGSATHAIALKSLDGLISDGTVRLAPPVLLKMDIEGYEPAALAGMAALLARHRPWIFFECEPQHLQRAGYDWPDLFKPLHALGYLILADAGDRFVSVREPIDGTVNYFALVPETMPPLPNLAPFLIR